MTDTEPRFIYHLYRETDSYDEASDFVIIARDSEVARKLAAAKCGDEGTAAWLPGGRSVIRKIGVATPPNGRWPAVERVVCRDGSFC